MIGVREEGTIRHSDCAYTSVILTWWPRSPAPQGWCRETWSWRWYRPSCCRAWRWRETKTRTKSEAGREGRAVMVSFVIRNSKIYMLYTLVTYSTGAGRSEWTYLGRGAAIRGEEVLVEDGVPAVCVRQAGLEVFVRAVLLSNRLHVNLEVSNLGGKGREKRTTNVKHSHDTADITECIITELCLP